ncbi:MAG: zinc dependent phospholipase C family protein [Flavobacteriales bacterium]|jgi:hypothetical protein|nr:zinc dependent phospholipase C family protein [Flavobacteriales bacterium]
MKLLKGLAVLSVIALLLISFKPVPLPTKHVCTSTWGFYGHKRINRMATFSLPPELFSFYKKNIEYVTEHAVDPDKRRYAAKGEAERHYIDIDHYVKPGEDPFLVMPRKWEDAVEKFGEDTLKAYGIVPWHLEVMVKRLTKAFKTKNLHRILQYSAELGHYVGDAHVPLHTTENYNGQLTGQKGIHGFWESRIPEISANDYDYLIGRCAYIADPLDKAWEIVKESSQAVDSVLTFEKELTARWPADQKYSYEHRGQVMMKVYSKEFSMEYQRMLGDMQERRMRGSIYVTASFWYTAWVNAGQPDLSDLNGDISEDMKKEMEKNDKYFKQGKAVGRDFEN